MFEKFQEDGGWCHGSFPLRVLVCQMSEEENIDPRNMDP